MKVKFFIIAAIVLLTVCACEEDMGENLFEGIWEGTTGDSYVFSDDKAAFSSDYKVTYNNLTGLISADGTYTFDGKTAELSFSAIGAPFIGKKTITINNNSFEVTILGIPLTYTKK